MKHFPYKMACWHLFCVTPKQAPLRLLFKRSLEVCQSWCMLIWGGVVILGGMVNLRSASPRLSIPILSSSILRISIQTRKGAWNHGNVDPWKCSDPSRDVDLCSLSEDRNFSGHSRSKFQVIWIPFWKVRVVVHSGTEINNELADCQVFHKDTYTLPEPQPKGLLTHYRYNCSQIGAKAVMHYHIVAKKC